MAGRCISVTHEALGTVRVMKTCGMMGEVVGRAASICIQRNCLPRDVYESHLDDLIELINLPGKAFRTTVNDKITIPSDAFALAGPNGACWHLPLSRWLTAAMGARQERCSNSLNLGKMIRDGAGEIT